MARRLGNHRQQAGVWVLQRAGTTGTELLDELLIASGFWEVIAAHRGIVAIKPDLDCYEVAPQVGTSPRLVEHLIDMLHDRGHPQVVVLDARSEDDGWLYNRDPMMVPDLVGYRFRTSRGRPYAVVDGRGGTAWRDAGIRINFAKNRTHEDCHFALCVHNLAALAPVRRELAEDALEVLRTAPPHFNIIDAITSAHGGAGQRAPRPADTHTLIASPNALLADWAGAARMGLDPYASPVNALALKTFGLPAHRLHGDLAPYPLWRNVHPLVARSARKRNASRGLGALSAAWFQAVDRERFGLRDFYSDRINALIVPLLAHIDDNPRALWIVVVLNLLLARLDDAIRMQQTMFAKEKLRRRDAPLLVDPFAIDASDYDAIEARLAPFESLLAHLPAGRDGLRWRHVDGAILFGNEVDLPLPFDTFVRRVDVAMAIRYMNDYIGGGTVCVRGTKKTRKAHQAERNIYLQQPNWMVLFGGDVIDVEKIQCIRRGMDAHAIHWRTIASPNGSATADDGSVAFLRTADGMTRVRIFALQKFTLPPAFQHFDINLAPRLRDPIIEGAYGTFFEGTIANLQAAYHGSEFRIGREPAPHEPRHEVRQLIATAAAAAVELLRMRPGVADAGNVLAWLMGGVPASALVAPGGVPAEADAAGFRHFPAKTLSPAPGEETMVAGLAALARDAPDFVAGLADAMRHDLDALANPREAE